MVDILKSKEIATQSTEIEKRQARWQRILLGGVFISIGGAAIVVGLSSIAYRMTHVIVENGLLNGRIVRLQAPASGNLQAFYARPGVEVKSGQVLAQLNSQPTPQEEQLRLQLERSQQEKIQSRLEISRLEGEVQSNESLLLATKQSLGFLKQQLQSLEDRYRIVQKVDIAIASQTVNEQQAAVNAAAAKAMAAKADYQRYQKLLSEGAVTQQLAETLRFTSESTNAELKQAQAILRSAKVALDGSKQGIALSNKDNIAGGLEQERTRLLQQIQLQQEAVKVLEGKVKTSKRQLHESLALSRNRLNIANATQYIQNRKVRISAPFTGIVYRTEREVGERVNQLEPLMSILNCNDLWVETVVLVDDASRINRQKPVKVQLAGYSETVTGEVDLIEPMGNLQSTDEQTKFMRSQALVPTIPSSFVGQPLARVIVRIPPPPGNALKQQFCGLGQSARLVFSK